MRIGLLGTLVVYDEAGRPVRVGGHRVRMLLILLALDAGRVVPTFSLIEQLWEDEPPANSGNALQSLVSRLRTALRQAGPNLSEEALIQSLENLNIDFRSFAIRFTPDTRQGTHQVFLTKIDHGRAVPIEKLDPADFGR